ncbi:MAG: carboxymuconolactone decarboxylase family protein [Planctomycetaceae bacterium]
MKPLFRLSVWALLCTTPGWLLAADKSPRPTPVNRTEMKRLLEEMKERTPRIPLPPLTAEELKATENEPNARGYEGRLRALYLPGAELRGYINFGGSPPRRPGGPPPRFTLEPDPTVTLDYGFKTKLFWIASRANNCQYCLGHQESKLLAVGLTDDDLGALDSNWEQFPANEQAAFAFARRLTLEPHRLSAADLDRCRQHYTDLQVLEMALSVGGNNAINRWKEGVGVPQSTNGGNFGGAAADAGHSYLTPTSDKFAKAASQVAKVPAGAATQPVTLTALDRPPLESADEVTRQLEQARQRTARLPLASDDDTRRVLGDLVAAGPVPAWQRLLANYPGAGLRTAKVFDTTEKQLALTPLTRARIAWVVARQDRAWYALGEARARLRALGQTDAQIADLDAGGRGLEEREQALLVVARNLGASPVVLTDEEFERALRLNSPQDLVQTVHYVAMRALFDRFTEAAAPPLD